MKYRHIKRDIENNIKFSQEALYYITKWELKNGEISIEDHRDSQCKGVIYVTVPEKDGTVTKAFNQSSKAKNWILDLVEAPVRIIQPGGTGSWY